MAGSLFSFTPDEQAVIRTLLDQYPDPTGALKARIGSVVDRLLPAFQGLILTEEQTDHLLAGLVDRLVARTLPDTDEPSEEDELRGFMVDLLVRHFMAEDRGGIIRRMLAPPRN